MFLTTPFIDQAIALKTPQGRIPPLSRLASIRRSAVFPMPTAWEAAANGQKQNQAELPSPSAVPIPEWVKSALDQWTRAAGVTEGKIFRAVARAGRVWGRGISQNVVWYVVKTCCERAGLEHIAPHDLRPTCAKLCHDRGGELEQIQFLLGHASVQTTERYLGCKQNLGHPVK